jgi:hypothetical protein
MNRFARATIVLVASQLLVLSAFAGATGGPAPTTTTTKTSRDDNQVFVGLNYNWGVRQGLTAVVGYRWARTSSSDRVTGGLVDVTIPLTGAPIGLGEIHLKGLAGGRSAQGELGVGYGFQAGAFLVNAAARGPYVTAGTDYLFGKGWQPYVGVSTLGRAKRADEQSTTTCPAGFTFDAGSGTCVADD